MILCRRPTPILQRCFPNAKSIYRSEWNLRQILLRTWPHQCCFQYIQLGHPQLIDSLCLFFYLLLGKNLRFCQVCWSVCVSVCLSVCLSVLDTITKKILCQSSPNLVSICTLGPDTSLQFLVFQGRRSRSPRSNLTFFSDFTKIAITSLILVVETRTKNQNVQKDELYNPSMIHRKYRQFPKSSLGENYFRGGAHNFVNIEDRRMK